MHALGLDMPADASPGGRILGDFNHPLAHSDANTLNRVGEAAGVTNKLMTAGRLVMGGMAGWAASSAAQDWAAQHGLGPLAQTLAGITGATARGAAARTVGSALPSTIGIGAKEGRRSPPTPIALSASRRLWGAVAGPTLSTIESGLGSLPIAGAPVTGARNAQSNAIANAADTTLQALSPGATSVREAGPESPTKLRRNWERWRVRPVFGGETSLKDAANQLENNAVIGQDRRVSAGPVLDAALDIATNPNNAAELRNAATAAHNQIASSVAPDGTITFGALKQARTALGANIDNMFQAQQGTRGIRNTLHAGMQSVEDAMTGQLADAAEQLRQAWARNGPISTRSGNRTLSCSAISNRLPAGLARSATRRATASFRTGRRPRISPATSTPRCRATSLISTRCSAALALPPPGARWRKRSPPRPCRNPARGRSNIGRNTLGSRGAAEIGPDAHADRRACRRGKRRAAAKCNSRRPNGRRTARAWQPWQDDRRHDPDGWAGRRRDGRGRARLRGSRRPGAHPG